MGAARSKQEPCIDCFHMTEIRSPTWQAQHGLTEEQAQARIDAAVQVVAQSPIRVARAKFDGGHFRQVFARARMAKPGSQFGTYRLEPDYVGFMGFARGVLEHFHDNHPDAERVDFVVERKTTVTHYLPNYLDELVKWATTEKRYSLLELIGEVRAGDKSRVPLQAADLAMWHIRRHEAREAKSVDVRRLAKMFNERQMTLNEVSNAELSSIAERARDVAWARTIDNAPEE